MPAYKLVYFNFRARAELARLIFAAAKVPYEDFRIERETWPNEYKQRSLFGQLPLLEVDGKLLAQSMSIARYLAREFNLAGKNSWEKAQVDMVVDELCDVNSERRSFRDLTDLEKKEVLTRKFNTETLPKHLGYLQNILKQNGGGTGFIVGDSLTWADLALVDSNDWLGIVCPNPFENFPLLHGLVKRVSEMSQVAEWLAKRPESLK